MSTCSLHCFSWLLTLDYFPFCLTLSVPVQNPSEAYLPENFHLEVSRVIGSLIAIQRTSTSWGSLLAFHRKKDAQASPFPLWDCRLSWCSKILHLWVTLPATIYPKLLWLKKPDVLIIYLSQLTCSVEQIYVLFQRYLTLLKCFEI